MAAGMAAIVSGLRIVRLVRVGVRRTARDRVALVLVGVVDLLAADLDRAVLLVLEIGRAELGGRTLVVAGLGVRAAVGLVLGLAVGPVLELLGRVALLELADLLLGLLELLLVGLGLLGSFSHPRGVPAAVNEKRPRQMTRPSTANPSAAPP